MIEEDYVSFETAKLLKEKGFDECCNLHYHYVESFDKWFQTSEYIDSRFKKYYYPCPTLQMAMKWLREVHNLWCEISWEGKGLWCMEVFSLIDEEFMPGSIVHEIKSYEEACEAAIKYCLENLI